MDVQKVQLDLLIRRLEAERGTGRKVRVLLGSWPLLLELSPQERERVAVAVGSRWALRNLETMFGHPGKRSANQRQISAIFEKMRDADPERLRRFGNEIKKGGVAGAQSRLLGALEEVLEEKIAAVDESQHPDSAVPPPPPPPPLAPLAVVTPDDPDESDEPEATEPTRPPEPKTEAADQRLDSKLPGEPDPSEHRLAASSEASEIAPVLAEATSTPAPQESEHELEPGPSESAAELARREEEQTDRRPRDGRVLSAVESLRVLRRLSSGESAESRSGPAGRAARAALVASLGSAWAARRAVSSMIRSRSAADLDEALTLIRSLPASSHQTWCLGDLLQHWELDDDARERIVAAAPTRAAKLRLARRRGARAKGSP